MNQLAQTKAVASGFYTEARPKTLWWQVLIIVLLAAWLYHSILFHLVAQWYEDPNFSHGFFVPAFSLFVLWRDRSRLSKIPREGSAWGLLIIAFSLCVLVAGVLGAELFLSRVSLPFLIAGLVVFFLGWNFLHAALFSWCFLFLMIPLPAIIFNQVTLPLQILASKLAAAALPWLGVPVLREGNIIHLPAMPLEVAEACSGIRSLLSLITLAVIYGYLIRGARWIRIVLALAAVPIAIAANGLRIIGTGLLVQYWDPQQAEGFFHLFSGWVIFLVSIGALFLLHRFLVWMDGVRRRGSGIQP